MTLSVLERFSTAFNRHWERLKQYNPAVYSTVETIAQWSAFFRYVKQKNPANWKDFVEKTGRRTVTDAPKILTPTAYELDYFKLIDLQ
jgi:hypothetical protein